MGTLRFLLFILFSFAVLPLCGQRLTGKITDRNGKSIEYVNVGIENLNVGVVSDGQGNFFLDLPDSLDGLDLTFSHISYASKSYSVRELRAIYIQDKRKMEVQLEERNLVIKPIEIRPGKMKLKKFGARVRVPGTAFMATPDDDYQIDEKGDTVYKQDYNSEGGTVFKIKDPVLIRELSFSVMKMTYDSLLVRVNLYKMESDSTMTPMHAKPYYIMVDKQDEEQIYTIDVSGEYMVANPGKIYGSIEVLKFFGETRHKYFFLPMYMGEGFYRTSRLGRFRKLSVNPGLQLRGVEL